MLDVKTTKVTSYTGRAEANTKLEKALDACTRGENAMVVGPKEGQHSAAEFVEYLIDTIEKL